MYKKIMKNTIFIKKKSIYLSTKKKFLYFYHDYTFICKNRKSFSAKT